MNIFDYSTFQELEQQLQPETCNNSWNSYQHILCKMYQ